jgi:hypothetical protein
MQFDTSWNDMGGAKGTISENLFEWRRDSWELSTPVHFVEQNFNAAIAGVDKSREYSLRIRS